jgi:hypothetical protein
VINPRRALTGFILFFLLTATVIVLLAFAHAWSPRIEVRGPQCFPDFVHSKFPMWLGCVIVAHEALAGGLIAAAGALFGAWLAFSGLKEQIAAEQQNIRTLQRAYISVEPIGISPLHSADGIADNVVGHIECRNVGHLPAQDCHFSLVRLKWVANDVIEEEVPAEVEVLEKFKQVVPVEARVRVGTNDRLRWEDYAQVRDRNGYLLVWGKITYFDGFETTRFVKFCHRYPCIRRAGGPGGYSISAEHARYHHYGNDAN